MTHGWLLRAAVGAASATAPVPLVLGNSEPLPALYQASVSQRYHLVVKAIILVLIAISVAHGAAFTGKIVGISDGDTLTVLTSAKEQVRVRLHGIDAPESKQAFGTRAKQELSSLAFGKEARVEVVEKDRYGRSVGRVFVDSMDVNVEMVRRGFAWWYRIYAKLDTGLATAEAEAKNAGRGIWADKSPVPPWLFRQQASKSRAVR